MPASFERTVDLLKAIAEPTRLRLVILLADHDLTVSDLTSILGQSQPRISRHLKLLVESGTVSRHQEGAWAYFRLGDDPMVLELAHSLRTGIVDEDGLLARDRERLGAVRDERAERASSYFRRNAEQWDRIRSLHIPDADVEAAMDQALGQGPLGAFLDIGTGTGRLLELMAPRSDRAVGIDASREMLAIARAKLDSAGLTRASVRQGDAYRLPVPRGAFDLATLHQVLHYLDDPAAAVREAALALRPGGRLVIVDFAPHRLEFLRTEHAHLRLGFSDAALRGYAASAGLELETVLFLPPAGDRPDLLTVVLLVARRPRGHSEMPASKRRTETA
ncbi:ArsR/SmtB family transcription factor [Aureimonas pseudogalii]|uniref:ArsR family transcriptional regulator n=1 Tax=Aureimonas pseudogalii TaxID=1744844 RepID=A0A7W6H4E9_9HYPH|nr:metalloregulator ArsR/SmtB family transcription factor [Aureimonas pseudogalii]MBB3998118.1 ArsR family transcriptional regulator [Aureimonas pseudogalii]